jgi:hypothetical protein
MLAIVSIYIILINIGEGYYIYILMQQSQILSHLRPRQNYTVQLHASPIKKNSIFNQLNVFLIWERPPFKKKKKNMGTTFKY